MEELKTRLDPEEFQTWFQPLRIRSETVDALTVLAPNSRFTHTLEASFREQVNGAAADLASKLQVRTPEIIFRSQEKQSPPEATGKVVGLNPAWRFETFLPGRSNELAHAAALAVAENPGSWNPLFICGEPGLGKTHLLHAIAWAVRKSHPGLVVFLVSAEQFTNELVTSIRVSRTPDFRARYREVDVLLVDEVDFLGEGNKVTTREEFRHTLDAVMRNGKGQVVFTSSRLPHELERLEINLRSRLSSGLIADIKAPSTGMKLELLRRLAAAESFVLPDEAAELVAARCSNMRELRGCAKQLQARSQLLPGTGLSGEAAEQVLDSYFPESRPSDMATLISAVARSYGIKVAELKAGRGRNKLPRQVCIWVMRQAGLSYPQIASHFPGQKPGKSMTHHTALYAVRRVVEPRRATDPDFARSTGRLARAAGVASAVPESIETPEQATEPQRPPRPIRKSRSGLRRVSFRDALAHAGRRKG